MVSSVHRTCSYLLVILLWTVAKSELNGCSNEKCGVMCKDDSNGNHICFNSAKCLSSAICQLVPSETHSARSKDLRALGARASIDGITMSGLSSGADFAVQFQVAFSSLLSGSCIFAGQTYHCAQTFKKKSCKTGPIDKVINTRQLVDYAVAEEGKGTIDRLSNLRNARLYLYRGKLDMRYQKSNGVDSVGAVQEFFNNFVGNPSQIKFEDSIASTHVWPTKQFGPKCGTARSQAMEACQYDGAAECLHHVYKYSLNKIHRYNNNQNRANYFSFDQRPFFGSSWPGLADEGVVYIPSKCQGKINSSNVPQCKLHVALHGCGVDHYYDLATKKSGFSEMAELNGIIILWPRMKQNNGNRFDSPRHFQGTTNTRLGCWDGWGETGSDYALKSGLQMAAVERMIDALVHPFVSLNANPEPSFEAVAATAEEYGTGFMDFEQEEASPSIDEDYRQEASVDEGPKYEKQLRSPVTKTHLDEDDSFSITDIPVYYYLPILALALLIFARYGL